jgi:hypothetical protein
MRLTALLLSIALIAAPAAAKPRKPAVPREPVVVELFTAQGCTDCPAANELLMKLEDRPGVIALTFAVDYWDYLGWKDTFAKPEFAERQHAYMEAMKLRDVYTPQIVVDGAKQAAGVKTQDVEAMVREAIEHRAYQPEMQFMSGGRVAVGSGRAPRGGANVWLVRYDDGVREVEVRKGDNRGQTIRHGNVVRELVKLGPWRGAPRIFRLPKTAESELKTVVIVQGARTGRIIGAKRL